MNFDWTSLLGYIFGGGFGLFELIKFLNTRKEEKKRAQLENDHTAVEAANNTTNTTIGALESIEKDRNELQERNRELRDQLDKLRTERGIGTMIICRNGLCPLRNPSYGLGPKWFEDFDGGEVTETLDNRPMEEIAEEKGYTLVRNMLKREDA